MLSVIWCLIGALSPDALQRSFYTTCCVSGRLAGRMSAFRPDSRTFFQVQAGELRQIGDADLEVRRREIYSFFMIDRMR